MNNAELIPLTTWLAQAMQIAGYNVIPDWRETHTWGGEVSNIIIYARWPAQRLHVMHWLCDHRIRFTHVGRDPFITICGPDTFIEFTLHPTPPAANPAGPLFAMEHTPPKEDIT